MKKIIVLFLAIISTTAVTLAQNETSVGVRIGIKRAGLTIQQDIGEKSKLEGIMTISKEDVAVTGLYEYHHPLGPKGLTFYGGLGGHFGKFYKSEVVDVIDNIFNPDSMSTSGTYTGLDLIGGLQYKIPFLPANISIDMKPALHLNGHPKKFQFQAGVSLRFLFGAGGPGGKDSGGGQGSGSGGGYGSGSGSGTSPTGTFPGGTSPTPSPTTKKSGKVKSKSYPNPTKTKKPTQTTKPAPTPPTNPPTDKNGDDKNNNGESWGDGGGL